MSYLIWPLGYVLAGLLMGVVVAPATRSDGRERREIVAMFVTAWPLIGMLAIAICIAPMLGSPWQSWPSAVRWLGWIRWLSGEDLPS